jgi:benzoyl-CoA reductase/2-hydroxyglutaryl-CoA dehydratase subunit BcrC/BadD/HgdB
MPQADPWRPFEEAAADPWSWVHTWKRQNHGPVVAHLLPDAPIELIHAAAALPVAISGASRPIEKAYVHLPSYFCGHVAGAIEMRLDGQLDCADALVIPYVCDSTRNLYHTWKHLFGQAPVHLIRFPKRMDMPSASGSFLKDELRRFAEFLFSAVGQRVSEYDLTRSIQTYNRLRAELRRAHQMHLEFPGTWNASRLRFLMSSALVMPPEYHLECMAALPWEQKDPAASLRPRRRVYVRGKLWDPAELATVFDDVGFVLAGDETSTGCRHIEQDAPTDCDPWQALATRFLKTVPYAGYFSTPHGGPEAFLERVQSSRAAGVVFVDPKFCETFGFDTPDFQNALKRNSIPSIVLETSPTGGQTEQIRTQLEAFSEMIRHSK